MMVTAIVVVFVATLLIGVPIAFVLGLSSSIPLLITGRIPLNAIPQYMFNGLNSFPQLAIPFFVLAGELMGRSGISKRLIRFCTALLGKIPGALAEVNILVSIFFAGITGAAVADTASVGAVLIPAMKEEGYPADYSAAVTAVSSCIGPIIPPSIILVVYGVAANVSISKLLIAGLIPGILMGVCQGILAFVHAKKRHYPCQEEPFSWREVGKAFLDAVPALIMPALIIGGIMSGVCTATEAASIAVVYSLLFGFATRTIKLKDLPDIIEKAAATIGVTLLLIGIAKLFSIVIALNQIPNKVTAAFLSVSSNKFVILLMINLLLLIAGCFMEISAACIILVPIILPVVVSCGIDPVQFGIIMCVNLAIGLATPPVGPTLYVACRIADCSIAQITKAIFPYLIATFMVVVLVMFIPQIALFLPNLLIA